MAPNREVNPQYLVSYDSGPLIFDESFKEIKLYDSMGDEEWPFVSTEKVIQDFGVLRDSESFVAADKQRAAEQILIAATFHVREEKEFADRFGVRGKIPDVKRWEEVAHVAIAFLATQPGYILDSRIVDFYPIGSS